MALRKQVAVPQHNHPQGESIGGGVMTSPEHQPPFLTLEETTTVETTPNEYKSATPRTNAASNQVLQQQQLQHQSLAPEPDSSQVENDNDDNEKKGKKYRKSNPISTIANASKAQTKRLSAKKLVSYIMFSFIGLVIWDAMFTAPEKRWIQTDKTDVFLLWVQNHPIQGLIALIFVIAAAVVVLIPIGTPLTLGCGYIYKGAYGWRLGLALATLVSMGGSALGAVICFLLGRYLFRDQVREWARDKYPLFDAIDIAASEHGLRIMAMLYLTPILPLGPVSYMCGTTSMALSSFVLAKVASLPLMLLYCFIGASTRTLLSKGKAGGEAGGGGDDMKSIEENETLIALGILLSFVMIAGITAYIRKELSKILERQEKHKPGEKENNDALTSTTSSNVTTIGDDEQQPSTMEMGTITTARRRGA